MIRTTIRLCGVAVLAGTLLVAGTHFVYYLYHWEWVRAQIAGVAFIAALVIAATRLVLARIARTERTVLDRIATLEDTGTRRTTTLTVPAPRQVVRSEPDFPWLAADLAPPRHRIALPAALLAASVPAGADSPRPAVFIPVLLGAGLAVSAVAGLVEHASAVAHAQPLRRQALSWVAAGLVVVAVVATASVGIWRVAHDFAAPMAPGTTNLTVQVATQIRARPPVETVGLVGRYCARTAITGVKVEDVRPRSPDSAVLEVSPVLHEQGLRRYTGCLEDAVLDRHALTVVDAVAVPREARS